MVDWLAVGWGGRVGKWPNGNLGNLQRQPTASGHSAVLALEAASPLPATMVCFIQPLTCALKTTENC